MIRIKESKNLCLNWSTALPPSSSIREAWKFEHLLFTYLKSYFRISIYKFPHTKNMKICIFPKGMQRAKNIFFSSCMFVNVLSQLQCQTVFKHYNKMLIVYFIGNYSCLPHPSCLQASYQFGNNPSIKRN